MAIKIANTTVIDNDRVFVVAAGTTAQRPTGALGKLRYNTTLKSTEVHNGTDWSSLELPVGTIISTVSSNSNPGPNWLLATSTQVLSQAVYPDLFNAVGLIDTTPMEIGTLDTPLTSNFGGDFAYGNGVYVAATNQGLYTSTNALNWVKRTSAHPSMVPQRVAFGNGVFVYGAGGTTTTSTDTGIATSTDGITWTARTSPITGLRGVNGLTYGPNGFLGIIGGGTSSTQARYITSTNGITWASGTIALTDYTYQKNPIYGNGKYAYGITGYSSNIASIATSTDLTTWSTVTFNVGSPGYYTYPEISYVGGSVGFILQWNAFIATSTDLVTFSAGSFRSGISPSSSGSTLGGPTYDGSNYYSVFQSGVVYKSPNLNTWSPISALPGFSLAAYSYINNRHLLLTGSANPNLIATSTDLITIKGAVGYNYLTEFKIKPIGTTLNPTYIKAKP
jgi:hypothetical protein